MEKIDQQLEILKKIKKVEVPSYLDGRILQKFNLLKDTMAPKNWKISVAAAAVILILLNLSIVIKITTSNQENGLQQFGNVMGLSTSNSLYHD